MDRAQPAHLTAADLAWLLVPPLAWFVDLEGEYGIMTWSCRTGRRAPLDVLSGLTAIVTIAAILAWRRRATAGVGTHRRSIATASVAMGLLFLLVIAANALARLAFDPCA
jgi:hypothetical protein